jgi:AAA domain
LPWVEARVGLSLAESQRSAVKLALVSKVLVITGGPGVGKTTIAILRILAAKGVGLVLCAPTGRAAKRMSETTGFEAKAIHRLLEVDPKSGGFNRGHDNPLDCDLVVVDETSMVDVMLMQVARSTRGALLKAIPKRAALLIVGDMTSFPRSAQVRCCRTSSRPALCRSFVLPRCSVRSRKAASSPTPIGSIREEFPILHRQELIAIFTSCRSNSPVNSPTGSTAIP